MIKFRCHNCKKKIGVQELYAGRRARCPQCGIPTRIPETEHGQTDMDNAKEKTQYSIAVYNAMGKEEDTSLTL